MQVAEFIGKDHSHDLKDQQKKNELDAQLLSSLDPLPYIRKSFKRFVFCFFFSLSRSCQHCGESQGRLRDAARWGTLAQREV